MSKLQNAIEVLGDWYWALQFKFFVWLEDRLEVPPVTKWHYVPGETVYVYKDRPDTIEALGTLLRENEELQAENDSLRAEAVAYANLIASGDHTKGESRPNRKKLTKREVETIHQLHRSGAKNVDIAYSFDVNPATISRIVRGQYYGKVAA